MVTDAPLEPGARLKDDFCQGCRVCIDACPVSAIPEDDHLDKVKCLRTCMPAGVGGLIRFLREFVETEDKEERLKKLRDPRLLEFHQYTRTGGYACAACIKVCPVGK